MDRAQAHHLHLHARGMREIKTEERETTISLAMTVLLLTYLYRLETIIVCFGDHPYGRFAPLQETKTSMSVTCHRCNPRQGGLLRTEKFHF